MSSNESEIFNQRHLFVPGRPITETVIAIQDPQTNTFSEENFKKLPNNIILAPLCQAFLKPATILGERLIEEEHILVRVVGFFDTRLNLTGNSFDYHFDLTLNLDGSYQLLIYIFYKQTIQSDGDRPLYNEGLMNFHFDFGTYFKKANVFDISQRQENQNHTKELSNVKTVKVFIANTNPETSRGTETTVQQGGG